MSIWSNIGDAIKAFFSKAVVIFKEFLAEALPIAKQIIIAALKEIAIQVVAKLDKTTLSDEEKRKQAFIEIKNYAITQGIGARDSIINLVIEIALQKVRG